MNSRDNSSALKRMRLFLWGAVALAVVAFGFLMLFPSDREVAPELASQIELGGPFELVSHNGATVTDEDFRGAPTIIYFGFATCPDVCPLSLHRLSGALGELGADADKLQALFITIDPERDTPELLREYLSFEPRITGLTGTPEQIEQVASAYRVYYRKNVDEGSALGYTMDHTSLFYLIGADGAFIKIYDDDTPPERLAADLASYI